MKTDQHSKNTIVVTITMVLLALAIFIECKSETRPNIPESELVQQQKEQWYEDALRAYNHLLHRIWIDRPNYVEDVLCETDEFCTLDSLMNGHWEDTFEFYNRRDAEDYYRNWYIEDALDPGCENIEYDLPVRVDSALTKIFDKY